MAPKHYDVTVIGGGPSGSTAGALLAQMGHRVAILEKEKFPRYHIGESLLPYCYFTLERLGVIDKMKNSPFVKKYSVQFVGVKGNLSLPFYFFQHLNHEAAQTWQVLRGEFDQMLLDNARAKGADVFEETTAKKIVRENGFVTGVIAEAPQGAELEFRSPVTVDASGRGVFSITRNSWRKPDPSLNKMALWTYYKGAKRDAGLDGGATTVAYLPEKGWFWYIPLHNDVVSVGIVAERDYLFSGTKEPEEIFLREAGNNEWIHEHLVCGRRCDEFRITSEYSYRANHCAENGLVLIGDAFAFLDPVFSSGVFLALRSGDLAADAIHSALEQKDYSARRFDEYGRVLCRSIEAMRKLVYAFYDQSFSFGQMLKKYPELRGDVTDCLIGNLTRDFAPLFKAVGEFARVPPELGHGKPLVGAVK